MEYAQVIAFALSLAFLAGACAPALTSPYPEVDVENQPVDGEAIISRVMTDRPSWIVIHNDLQGSPGAVIGFSPLVKGVNNNVVVRINNTAGLTSTLYAMLHYDLGSPGIFEYPGPDKPVTVGIDRLVMKSFRATDITASGTINKVSINST